MTLQVKQFRYSADNLSYLIYGEKSAIAIDGGAVDGILSFLDSRRLNLRFVTNTHSHMDHTTGDKALLQKTDAEFLENSVLLNNNTIELDGTRIDVYHTPGHTSDSVSFRFNDILISGDTLFNGKAGRCFSGDLKGFYTAIRMIMTFPSETIIYAGHDYVEEYMAFAKKLEPDNTEIDRYLKKYNPDHVFSTLRDEFKVNPHLRFNDEKMIAILKDKGFSVESEYDRWVGVMSL